MFRFLSTTTLVLCWLLLVPIRYLAAWVVVEYPNKASYKHRYLHQNHHPYHPQHRLRLRLRLRPQPGLCLQASSLPNRDPFSKNSRPPTQNDADQKNGKFPLQEIRIRSPTFGEMGAVANTIMKCFYPNAQSPAKHLYRLSELNRIQQNFAYGSSRSESDSVDDVTKAKHRMIVAVTDSPFVGNKQQDKIVAFCDIDARPATNKRSAYRYNPRPYLSDLCVDPEFQRRGIAQMLVLACEKTCRSWNKTEVFIRVERSNVPAVTMYQKLGYEEYVHPDEPSIDTMMLRKELALVDRSNSDALEQQKKQAEKHNMTQQQAEEYQRTQLPAT